MTKPKERELTREECTTEELRREYSYQRWKAQMELGPWSPPSALLDFPLETEDWHHPTYWIEMGKQEEQQRRLKKNPPREE